jgi:hypothetical protein
MMDPGTLVAEVSDSEMPWDAGMHTWDTVPDQHVFMVIHDQAHLVFTYIQHNACLFLVSLRVVLLVVKLQVSDGFRTGHTNECFKLCFFIICKALLIRQLHIIRQLQQASFQQALWRARSGTFHSTPRPFH